MQYRACDSGKLRPIISSLVKEGDDIYRVAMHRRKREYPDHVGIYGEFMVFSRDWLCFASIEGLSTKGVSLAYVVRFEMFGQSTRVEVCDSFEKARRAAVFHVSSYHELKEAK